MKNKTEEKILKLFAFNHKLKFNEIEKSIKERSNKIAYHLKQLIKKRVIKKESTDYMLSDNSEYLIPYLSEKSSILPVILVHLGNKKSCFLYKRTKRPYKNLLSLPGGRILIGESIKKAVLRIMKDKFNIKTRLKKINSISLEHIRKSNKIVNSFLLIFVTAETKDNLELINIEKNKKQIIKSDYQLLKKFLNSETNINTINSKI
ncbi:MAG TPA: NUDIX domain-containing protein [Candidatus Paceibacterota bacterium]|nr:NUDIX domain-containing protein [Candidatus Paceibacterota bacterium]